MIRYHVAEPSYTKFGWLRPRKGLKGRTLFAAGHAFSNRSGCGLGWFFSSLLTASVTGM
jgi:hypothetical protein